MKPAFMACLAGSVLLAACVHTRQIGYEMSQDSPEKMLRTVGGEEVVVTLDDSTVVSGVTLAIGPDTLHLRVASGKDSVWHLPGSG